MQPYVDLVNRQLIKKYPIRPAYVTQAFLSLARHYFTKEEYLVTDRFRKKHNHSVIPSPEDMVIIESPMAWPVELTDKRPAIFVRRLNWTYRRLGIGDGRWGGTEAVIQQNTYSWAWRGHHIFFLISKEGGELDLLTEEVINLLARFTPVIRSLFDFTAYQLASIGKVEAYTSTHDYFQVPLIVQYDWIETWQLEPGIETVREIITEYMS